MFLMQQKLGVKISGEWAENVWNILEAQGEANLKDGKFLTSRHENVAE